MKAWNHWKFKGKWRIQMVTYQTGWWIMSAGTCTSRRDAYPKLKAGIEVIQKIMFAKSHGKQWHIHKTPDTKNLSPSDGSSSQGSGTKINHHINIINHGTSWDIMGPWDMKPPQPSKPTSIFPAFLGIPNSPVSGTRFAKSRRSVEWNAGSARWETWQRSWRIWYSNQLSHGCFNRNAYNGLLKQSPHSRGSILNPRYIYIYLKQQGFFSLLNWM